MSNVFSPGGRRRIYQPIQQPAQPAVTQSVLEQYEKLSAFYQKLLAQYEEQAKTLELQTATLQAKTQELEIKNEALQRQSADMRQLEGDLLWTRVALEQAEKELHEAKAGNWQERYQTLQTELEALRKRWEVRYTNEVAEARHRILVDMLPLADHLDLALQHVESDQETLGTFISNIEATRRAFLETLKRYGIERLDAQGQPFDPNRHEAIAYIDDPQTPADHVTQVVQVGYLDGERLLRPVRVVVSRGYGDSKKPE